MEDYQLHVRGYLDGSNVERIRPVFVWKASGNGNQFTVEMARDREFSDIIFMRDTHEHYCIYDNVPLKPNTQYYVRVRNGIRKWHNCGFTTGE